MFHTHSQSYVIMNKSASPTGYDTVQIAEILFRVYVLLIRVQNNHYSQTIEYGTLSKERLV